MESDTRFNPYVKVPPEEEIVISGMSGRFPNTDNVKELGEHLLKKMDLGSEDDRRWNNVYYNMPRRSGKVNNLEKFDAQYFNMTFVEAHVTDPLCRILLEHTYEAIVDAGVNPKELQGSKTGVFIGTCYSSAAVSLISFKPQVSGFPMLTCSKYWQANVISRWLNLKGPSYTLDTACSSSHYALAEAYRMIRNGECDAAIVGGSNLCLHPYISLQFYQLGVLSSDGYCRPFDDKGSGYMRSEALVIVFLQKAKDARRIYANFVYAKTNCDGFKEEGITYPSASMQKELLEEFYEDCSVAPEEVSFMEAHATGTVAGDPVEIAAIDQALCLKRTTPLLLGSVKSNIGHSEPPSGLCSVVKVLLAMETGVIAPNIHYNTPRKELPAIIEGRIKIVIEPTLWEGGYAGVNSFGFGGGNCHILLKSNPKIKASYKVLDELPRLVAVSGRTEEAVRTILDDVNNRELDVEYIALLHRLHAENMNNHVYRGYTIAGCKITNNVISKVENDLNVKKPICFVFSATEVTCNKELMQLPVFAEAIQKCNAILKKHGIHIADTSTKENKAANNNTVKSFLETIVTQIGMVDLLTHIGIVPDYMMSYSIGDLICEYVDGRFTVEEIILTAYHVGVALDDSKLQVDEITENCYEPYGTVKSQLFEHFGRTLPQRCSKGRGVTWLGRSRLEWDRMSVAVAEHYINNILQPVSFARLQSLIPKDTVIVNILPHVTFASNITNTLEWRTLVLLGKRDQQSAMHSFLEGIGDLYNAGFQPQISSLYPPVEFPVSRGTPMISHLVRWDHSDDFYVFSYKGQEKIYDRVKNVKISTSNIEYDYMSGHVIDGKNLLPATGYLYEIWVMISLLNGIDYFSMPIVFEDVKFIRAVHLSKQDTVKLTLKILKASNYFEIVEEDAVVVTGTVRIPENIEDEKLPVQFLPKLDDTEQSMSAADIYKELRIRGYQYEDSFRLLKSASMDAKTGYIKWSTYWVAFIDNMLQMRILTSNLRNLFVPTQIRKLTIDPTNHAQKIRKSQTEKEELPVRIYDYLDAIVSGGIEICGLKASAIPRKVVRAEAVHEDCRFVAHHDRATMSLKNVVKMSVHIALECYELINVKVIEFIQDKDGTLPEDLITPIVQDILNDLPLVCSDLTLVAADDRFDSTTLPPNLSIVQLNKLPKDNKYLIAVGARVLAKGVCRSTDDLLSYVTAGGFLLTRESLIGNYDSRILQHYNLNVILEKCTDKETLVLLKRSEGAKKSLDVVRINNREFSWIDELKSVMESSESESTNRKEIIVVAQNDSECGILGFVNCLRKEPGGEIIRCVFIQDKNAPEFSLEDPFYANQLRLNLPINVLRAGQVWGSYRHFSLPSPEPRPVRCGYVFQGIRGDLSTLRWVEGRVSPSVKREDIKYIFYAGLNFKDIMVATGKLALESLTTFGRDVDSILGFEFAGVSENGQRIMALCPTRALSNTLVNNDNVWACAIPDEWTFEEAATVPCVYTTCYYALYMKGQMQKGDKILIHSGTGGVGQAAINLALHEGCEVFTTVGTNEKRQFIKKAFPSIPDSHIGNSRDTTFEQMINRETHGRGVNIVLNSLAEEKLQASVRCLARNGRFLEIGKYDLISNNTLDTTMFAKGISFYGIMTDKIITDMSTRSQELNILQNYLLQGLKSGAVKPLPRKVFEKTDVEAAFRYMAAGKHIGKVLVKIRDEREPLDQPIFAQPRYFCEPDKSYVILGGLGGFGLELADWLIFRGARKFVLTSRTGVRNGYQRSRLALWKSYGANVKVIAGSDASNPNDCAFILRSALELGPVDAIFNLAVVLKDSIFKNQTAETFEESLKPKAGATMMLDELSREMCPDLRHFVVFSSVSCGRGNAGQTNYGMANSIMERICERRAQEGLPGMAIQWGAIGDVGLVADMQEDNKELIIGGTLQQRIQSCLQSLDVFLVQNRLIVGSMVVAEKRAKQGRTMNVLETVASIMGLNNMKMVRYSTRLSELGMDSMMAVEIKQVLERDFDIYLAIQDIRNLTFAKLRKLTEEDGYLEKKIEPSLTSENKQFLFQIVNNLVLIPDICLEMSTKPESNGERIFLLPGIEGCGSVFNALASKIKGPATCLQHGVNNIATCDSVVQSAATLLPHVLMRMKDSTGFVIVGYSYGSLIAIELVSLLESMNLKGRLILIDGTPDYMKAIKEQFFPFTTIQEFQNNVLLGVADLVYKSDTSTILLELCKCDKWEEKMDVFFKNFPEEVKRVTTAENYKIYCTTIYKHLLALQEYNLSSPTLKSPILLIKPTAPVVSTEKDYGLRKVTKGTVHIHYVEGDHITMLNNDEVADAINGNLALNLMEV